jgi:hypothetical protein
MKKILSHIKGYKDRIYHFCYMCSRSILIDLIEESTLKYKMHIIFYNNFGKPVKYKNKNDNRYCCSCSKRLAFPDDKIKLKYNPDEPRAKKTYYICGDCCRTAISGLLRSKEYSKEVYLYLIRYKKRYD